MLPESGSVLGMDVGCSPSRPSSAICRLDWTASTVAWTIRRFRATLEERDETVGAVAGGKQLLAAAFDGPFRGDLSVIGRYRAAERMLTDRTLREAVGKPGQSSAPVGRLLNEHTNYCVKAVLEHGVVADAVHAIAVHPKSVVEAFPNTFLGVMIDAPSEIAVSRSNRSDLFFDHLARATILDGLLTHHLPGRSAAQSIVGVVNHDDRAALICALTALGVAAGDFTSVGDEDGHIVLPPLSRMSAWAAKALAGLADASGTFRVVQPS